MMIREILPQKPLDNLGFQGMRLQGIQWGGGLRLADYVYLQFFETGEACEPLWEIPLSWLFCICLEIKHRRQIDECRFSFLNVQNNPGHDLRGNSKFFLPPALSSQVSELSGRRVGKLQNLQGRKCA